jgi:uncharacterized GH25 family protein
MAKAILLTVLVCSSTIAAAHDLYLVTGVRGAEGKICARIGEAFPESTNALTPDRLEVFAARTNQGISKLQGKVLGKQLCAAAPSNGDFVAEIVVQPRFIKLANKDFDQYIESEGLKQVIRVRAEQGGNVEGRELYSRYAKLIAGRSQKASSVLGHVLEIVLEKDPAELKPDDQLPVRVLFRGKPLADAQVAAVYAGAKLEGHKYPVTSRTDSEGSATLNLDRPGLWYARLIHMVPAVDDPEINWRSFFATVTFNVAQPSQGR